MHYITAVIVLPLTETTTTYCELFETELLLRKVSSTCRLCVLAGAFLTNNMRLSNGISETKPTLMRVYTMVMDYFNCLQLLLPLIILLVSLLSSTNGITTTTITITCAAHFCGCCLCLSDLSYHNQHTYHSLTTTT
jgi:ABC-type methionine transport system permease subunit